MDKKKSPKKTPRMDQNGVSSELYIQVVAVMTVHQSVFHWLLQQKNSFPNPSSVNSTQISIEVKYYKYQTWPRKVNHKRACFIFRMVTIGDASTSVHQHGNQNTLKNRPSTFFQHYKGLFFISSVDRKGESLDTLRYIISFHEKKPTENQLTSSLSAALQSPEPRRGKINSGPKHGNATKWGNKMLGRGLCSLSAFLV